MVDERPSTHDLYFKLLDEVKDFNRKIDSLVKSNKEILSIQKKILRLLNKNKDSSYSNERVDVPDVTVLLSLPTSLRKTMLALYNLVEATAEDLSKETKRKRAVESYCANQLTRMGYIEKKRVGRRVYFYINYLYRGVKE